MLSILNLFLKVINNLLLNFDNYINNFNCNIDFDQNEDLNLYFIISIINTLYIKYIIHNKEY